MSLLLEALKRAADAKRKQEEERIAHRTGERAALELESTEPEPPNNFSDPKAAALRAEAIELLARDTRQRQAVSDDMLSGEVPSGTYLEEELTSVKQAIVTADDYTESQRVARSVFDSKMPFRAERVRHGFLIVASFVGLLGALVIAGYQYYTDLENTLSGELARSRQLRRQAAPPPVAQEIPRTDSVTEVIPETNTHAEVSVSSDVAGPALPRTEKLVATSIGSSPEPDPINPSAEVPKPAATLPVATAAEEPTPTGLSIVRNPKREQISAALTQGYAAFQRGDLEVARAQYQKALHLDAGNRDASLGEAAILIREDNTQAAGEIYQTLLRANPNDSAALAGLTALANKLDPRRRESELKLALKRAPKVAELHFALGSLYSEEQRWPDAQAAFFRASTFDKNNPDYLFNLAVTLEHLGKVDAALDYYQQALQAAQTRNAAFDVTTVQNRIELLRTTGANKK